MITSAGPLLAASLVVYTRLTRCTHVLPRNFLLVRAHICSVVHALEAATRPVFYSPCLEGLVHITAHAVFGGTAAAFAGACVHSPRSVQQAVL